MCVCVCITTYTPSPTRYIVTRAVLMGLERVGGVSETTNCEGYAPFEPKLTGDTPFKIPPYSLFRPKGGRNFHGLIPDTNYKHLECFITLGTHSEPRRGQMSHICDISPLRVKTERF